MTAAIRGQVLAMLWSDWRQSGSILGGGGNAAATSESDRRSPPKLRVTLKADFEPFQRSEVLPLRRMPRGAARAACAANVRLA